MSFRTLSFSAFLLALLPGPAAASEGLKFAAAYMCDPQRVTEAMVQACIRRDVSLSSRFAAALKSWTGRNDSEIQRLKNECVAELTKRSSSDAELQDFMAAVNRLNDEAIAAMARNEADLSFCGEMLTGLETGKSDLKNFFPPK